MNRLRVAHAKISLTAAVVPLFLSGQTPPLRQQVEALHDNMVAAFAKDPVSVAQFYTDDASILGGGSRYVGRSEVERYWRQSPAGATWVLEVLEVGGDVQAPWVRGRSTLTGLGGRRMQTEYIGILKRQPDGQLKFYIDMYVSASPGMVRRTPGDTL